MQLNNPTVILGFSRNSSAQVVFDISSKRIYEVRDAKWNESDTIKDCIQKYKLAFDNEEEHEELNYVELEDFQPISADTEACETQLGPGEDVYSTLFHPFRFDSVDSRNILTT
eukprot:snap_masked-scaffold_14-processed-gene-5.27-mRNA-1 protein AED:1.00 eAED:1.00 QI:0/0/0/0/1/1/2/0/112